jgi:GABA(A) receptor-associated protein
MLKSFYSPPEPNTYFKYKQQHSFELRSAEAARIVAKYPDRIPIICEPNLQHNSNLPIIDKNKYLVPIDLTVGQFLFVIRKRLKMHYEQALYLFVNGSIPPTSELVQNIYHTQRDTDGFLYFTYNCENTFGAGNLRFPCDPSLPPCGRNNRAEGAETHVYTSASEGACSKHNGVLNMGDCTRCVKSPSA